MNSRIFFVYHENKILGFRRLFFTLYQTSKYVLNIIFIAGRRGRDARENVWTYLASYFYTRKYIILYAYRQSMHNLAPESS